MGKKLGLKPLEDRVAVRPSEGQETTRLRHRHPRHPSSSGPAGAGRPWAGQRSEWAIETTGIERDAVSGLMTEEQRTQRSYIDRALSRRRKIRRPVSRERTKLPSALAWS
jgi:hypothetical protein